MFGLSFAVAPHLNRSALPSVMFGDGKICMSKSNSTHAFRNVLLLWETDAFPIMMSSKTAIHVVCVKIQTPMLALLRER